MYDGIKMYDKLYNGLTLAEQNVVGVHFGIFKRKYEIHIYIKLKLLPILTKKPD